MLPAVRRLPQSVLPALITRCSSSAGASSQTFYHKELEIIEATSSERKSLPTKDQELGFGSLYTDHMLETDWQSGKGWTKPQIHPYRNFSIDPAAKVFHYACELFEGLKAYRGDDGRIRLFRPELNMKRMIRTAKRATLPNFDSNELLNCIKDLVRLDQAWVPQNSAGTLYIRPTMIATDPTLGVRSPSRAKLYVILSPVGPYFKSGWKPVKLLADAKYVRAAKGGVGAYKMGCNYAPTLSVGLEAEAEGFQQVLWLYGPEHYVTEVGAMNIFMYWKNEKGEDELITPALESGIILPGVTRQSILDLAREMDNVKVTERDFTMDELLKAKNENRIQEIFGSGTAVVVAPVDTIVYKINNRRETINLPIMEESKSLMAKLFKAIKDIQYGRKPRPDWTHEI